MDEKLQQRVELEGEIKGAIAAGQIVPYYQPRRRSRDVKDRRLRGVGAMGAPDAGGAAAEFVHPHRRGHRRHRRDDRSSPRTGDKRCQAMAGRHLCLDSIFRHGKSPTLDWRPKFSAFLGNLSFPPHRLDDRDHREFRRAEVWTMPSWRFSRFEMSVSVLRSTISAPAIPASIICARSNFDTIKIDRSFVSRMVLDKPHESKIVEAQLSALSRCHGPAHVRPRASRPVEVLDQVSSQSGLRHRSRAISFGKAESATLTTEALPEHLPARRS